MSRAWLEEPPRHRQGRRHDHQRPEAWTTNPIRWTTTSSENAVRLRLGSGKSPAGAWQWIPTDPAAATAAPDPHDLAKRRPPVMLTTDLALRMDPIYEPISRRFMENPDEFADAFARAWFKLLHRDIGPISATSAQRCLPRK